MYLLKDEGRFLVGFFPEQEYGIKVLAGEGMKSLHAESFQL